MSRLTHTRLVVVVSLAAALVACDARTPAVATDPFAPVPHEPNTVAYEPRERRVRAGCEALRVETEELDANDRTWRAIHTWTWPWKLRVERRPSGGSVAQYTFVHRHGDDVWLRAPLERHSRVATDVERRAVALEGGLRTAALLWPDGDTWTIEDGMAHALSVDPLLEGVFFDAELDTNGRPMRVEARAEGASVELADWREFGARWVPCELSFAVGGLTWSESVTKFAPCSPFDDVFFIPVELSRDDTTDAPEVRTIDALPRGACRRETFASATTIDDALRAAEARLAELAREGVHADVLVELAPDDSAAALVVRLGEGVTAGDGFEVPPPRRAVSLRLDTTTPEVIGAARSRLEARLPAGAVTGAPYLWSGADGRHLVLPRH